MEHSLKPTAPAGDLLPALASLQEWASEAKEALAENTLRAFRVDSQAFAAWCEAEGLPTLPASPQQVARFLRAEAAAGKAVATIRRRASTIARMHTAAGLPSPCASELVRLALKGLARQLGTDQRQAAALTQRDADTIKAKLGDSLKDVRDLALILVGRDLLARSSELVALEVGGIEWAEDGATVSLRRRKTSTETVAYWIGQEAAEALRAWLSRAGITEGLVFRSLKRGGKVTERGLDTRDVRALLKARAQAAGLKHASSVSGHSLRVGMAGDLVAADLDLASVMQAGGWKSPSMVARYTERITARRGAVARFYGK